MCNLLVSRFMEDVKKKYNNFYIQSFIFPSDQRPEKNSPTFDKLNEME